MVASPTTTLDRLRCYLRQNHSRLRAAPTQAEQLDLLAQIQQSAVEDAVASLVVVEHATMQAEPVRPVPQPNALRHFLDGIQRQRILYYEGVVPVFYAYLSAVVRSRVERRMCCLRDGVPFRQRDALYAPLGYVDVDGLRQHGIPLRDTEPPEPLPSHPALIQQASNRISNDREILERELAQEWLCWLHQRGREDWLVVDGGIAELASAMPEARLIGIAKTSTSVERALTPEQMQVVYSLRKGERSSVFAITRAGQPAVYSWFLRLHDPAKGSLLYGLLRVEMPASEKLLSHVNALCAWLLEDRVPLSVPDTRYDRLLYPMRDCEQYLRALAPSTAQLEALAQMV
ncbi:MAG: hypothetical protein RMM08_10930 [Armatimonadota bacterium]|nr:hypothetical protein [bacterium]MDW8321865.1 hypothetical protein [Armatimonadota bacterium]